MRIKMEVRALLLLLVINFVVQVHPYITNNKERFLSLFTVMRIKNVDCGSGNDMGTCYTAWECLLKGGTNGGSCGGGFGRCCVTKLGCGGSSANNSTWIQSPGYSGTFNGATSCKQTITIADPVCQLRLDIIDLDLAPPDTTGTCQNDYLTVSQDNKFDRLCGTTTDNHFYLDVMPSMSTSVDFDFVTDSTDYDRKWNIKVTQICCDQLSMAPSGCGQYYTGTSGTIKGLNYDGSSATNRYLSGLNYAICTRKEQGQCSAEYAHQTEFFRPECGDTFEFPSNNNAIQMVTCLTIPSVTGPLTETATLQGPHYFYFTTTTDTTNTHNAEDSTFAYNYLINYQQAACT